MKIPDLIAKSLHLREGEDSEISIHSEPAFAQGELWGDEEEEIDENLKMGDFNINDLEIVTSNLLQKRRHH